MKLKLITTSDNENHEGWLKNKASLEKWGWDYEHIHHKFEFGKQLLVVRDWCENYRGEATHFVYADAFDTVCFAGMDEVMSKLFNRQVEVGPDWVHPNPNYKIKMLISGEKACYPLGERSTDYPKAPTWWQFINAGGILCEIEYFKQLCIKENFNANSHDAIWLMDAFLNNQSEIKIDYQCEIFQTIAHSHPEEWQRVGERFINKAIGSFPVFFHANGKTSNEWMYI